MQRARVAPVLDGRDVYMVIDFARGVSDAKSGEQRKVCGYMWSACEWEVRNAS